ncbi:MAG: phosphatase PAP2 family protein [Gemmatimonadales bacterium]
MNSAKRNDELSQRRTTFDAWLLPVALGWSLLMLGIGMILRGDASALRPLYNLSDPRVGPAGFGAFVGHAILCGSDVRRRRVLRAGVVLEVLRMIAVLASGVPLDSALLSTGYGFLAAALADFLLSREWRYAFLTALVPIGMAAAPVGLGGLVRKLTPKTFDGALLALDATFRVPFSKLIGELFEIAPPIAALSLISYAILPGAIAAGLAYEEYNHRRGVTRGVGVNLLLAYAVSGTIAALLYILCPATGPAHAFKSGFPSHLPDSSTVSLILAPYAPLSPRNAMPSLHFGWGVLLARSTAGARRSVRLIALSFAVMTAIATIGSGEHYVLDLIAAVPFVVALEAATARGNVSRRRRMALISGVLLFGSWIATVRSAPNTVPFFESNPALVWGLAVVTIVACVAVALRNRDAHGF